MKKSLKKTWLKRADESQLSEVIAANIDELRRKYNLAVKLGMSPSKTILCLANIDSIEYLRFSVIYTDRREALSDGMLPFSCSVVNRESATDELSRIDPDLSKELERATSEDFSLLIIDVSGLFLTKIGKYI